MGSLSPRLARLRLQPSSLVYYTQVDHPGPLAPQVFAPAGPLAGAFGGDFARARGELPWREEKKGQPNGRVWVFCAPSGATLIHGYKML